MDLVASRSNGVFRKPWFRRYEICETAAGGDRVVLVRPLTFMNRSGDVLPGLLRKYGAGVPSLVVVCDNLDLPPGTVRLKRGGSDAGHRGLQSVISRLGSSDFVRLYVGIGRPAGGKDVVGHVLGSYEAEEVGPMREALARAARAIVDLSSKSVEDIMNEINRKTASG